MKLISVPAAILAALTLAVGASAQVPVLPAPPVAGGPAASAIFDAMLAIARAAASNPAAATQASFSYNAAIQQYQAKDFARSQMSALKAISQTAAVPLPQPSLFAPPIPQPSFYAMPLIASSGQADAEAYVALARRALTVCGAPNVPAAAIVQQYAAAANALVAKNDAAAKRSAQYVIDQCAAATQAYAAQQAAKPQPPSTPIPMESYSPLPVATMIPDPALQGAKP